MRQWVCLAVVAACWSLLTPPCTGNPENCTCEAPTGEQVDAASLPLDPTEREALLAFREGIDEDGGLLSDWTNATHPCAWAGVVCSCDRLPPPARSGCPKQVDPLYAHVLGIYFGPAKPPGLELAGHLSPYLGNLTRVVAMHLDNNKLRGTIPAELSKLDNLSGLFLAHNELTGTLPPELGGITSLKRLVLNANQLEGNVPEEWCALLEGSGPPPTEIALKGNELICGDLPQCFSGSPALHPTGLTGTCLAVQDETTGKPLGGVCDGSPPLCREDGGCLHIPNITNRIDGFQFNFSDFEDNESGIREYRWMLGTAPGLSDAVAEQPLDVTPHSQELYNVSYKTTSFALVNGGKYFVTLVVANGACPEVTANVSSTTPVLVDTTPPLPQMENGRDLIFANADCTFANTTQRNTSVIHGCWHKFIELESSLVKYEVAVLIRGAEEDAEMATNEEYVTEFSGEGITCAGDLCTVSRTVDLMVGHEYNVVVKAYNIAMDFSVRQSGPVLIVGSSTPDTVLVAVLVGACLGLLLLICLLLAGFLYAWYLRKRRLEEEEVQKKEYSMLRHLLHETIVGLVGNGASWFAGNNTEAVPTAQSIFDLKEVFFVFTDIEESTTMAAADPITYSQVQEIHDSLIRRELALHSGYEINTQGDAFEIAFHNIESAVRFCMKVQMELLKHDWSKQVLALPTCAQDYDGNGQLRFAGPRIRMGIHLAKKGTFKKRLNALTHHIQFEGPGYLFAEEFGDSGHGGQIIMSGVAFQAASRPGALTPGLAVYNHIGMFRLAKSDEPTSVFEVLPPLTARMPTRWYPLGLRNQVRVAGGAGMRTVTLPPASSGKGNGIVICSMPEDVSDDHTLVLKNNLAASGQLFKAYQSHQIGNTLLYILPSAAEAVRFAMVAQMSLMCANYPGADKAIPKQYSKNGTTLLFRGVRVGMVVHLGPIRASVATSASVGKNALHLAVQLAEETVSASMMKSYVVKGEAVKHAEKFQEVLHPGQVIITDIVWQEIQATTFRGVQVVSLGKHRIAGLDEPTQLIEMTPLSLARRKFPPLDSLAQVEPGYHEAPDTDQEVAIMFCKIASCQDSPPVTMTAEEMNQVYLEGMLQWCTVVRGMILKFHGYECKEIQGKFTLCFTDIRDAIAFAVSVQVALQDFAWNPKLLELSDFAPKHDEEGQLLSVGITPSIGICWGRPTSKKPLQSTGRADYFGPVPNRAARCMASAAKGQVLVDGKHLHRLLGHDFPDLKPKNNAISVFSTFQAGKSMRNMGKSFRQKSMKRLRSAKQRMSLSRINLERHSSSRQRLLMSNFSQEAEGESLESLTNTRAGKKILRLMNHSAKFEEDIYDCPLPSPDVVHMRGLGLFALKGIKEPVALVQAWLSDLDARNESFLIPKGNVVLNNGQPEASDGSALSAPDPSSSTQQGSGSSARKEGTKGGRNSSDAREPLPVAQRIKRRITLPGLINPRPALIAPPVNSDSPSTLGKTRSRRQVSIQTKP